MNLNRGYMFGKTRKYACKIESPLVVQINRDGGGNHRYPTSNYIDQNRVI